MLDGKPVDWRSPLDARRNGIAVIHQHPGLFGDLSVAENIWLGHMPRDRFGGIDHARMERDTAALIDVVGLACQPGDTLDRLRTSEQQLVEIARALSMQARVLIMDEPTASLSQREVERLFAVVADLKLRGVAMMFVGHRMDEIFRVADRIAVLRDGHLVGVEAAHDLDRDKAVQMMIGRTLSSIYPPRDAVKGKVALEVRSLAREENSTTSPSPCGAARSSASGALSVVDAPKSRGHCSASPGRAQAKFSSTVPRAISRRPMMPWQHASPMSPRTGSARAW